LQQFVSNIRHSWNLTQIRIDRDPVVALEDLCGG
jgi:hypothetical protein